MPAPTEFEPAERKTVAPWRDVPLNDAAIKAIKDLRQESYFGENAPLVCDHNGDFTRPVNFRKRYYKILKAAGIEHKVFIPFVTRMSSP